MKLPDLDSPNIGESTKSRSVCNPTDQASSPMRPITSTVSVPSDNSDQDLARTLEVRYIGSLNRPALHIGHGPLWSQMAMDQCRSVATTNHASKIRVAVG